MQNIYVTIFFKCCNVHVIFSYNETKTIVTSIESQSSCSCLSQVIVKPIFNCIVVGQKKKMQI